MKNIYKWIALFVLVCGIFLCDKKESEAAPTGNISVTVPGTFHVLFEADGTTQVQPFRIDNGSPVPIWIESIYVEEQNGWQLVDSAEVIEADQKKLAFSIEGQLLKAGNNPVDIEVVEYSPKYCEVEITRGAWNKSVVAETAFSLEVEYRVGAKLFTTVFDSNGSKDGYQPDVSYNGSVIHLPTPFLVKHDFLGWEDENGILHRDAYTVPMKDVVLTAKWQRTEAYAIFCVEEQALYFVRSVTPLVPGDICHGKTVTEVYSGIEEDVYNGSQRQPWIQAGGVWGGDVTTVKALDVIQPLSTAYWFYGMGYLIDIDLTLLDMSQAVNMTAMFSSAGQYVTDTIRLRGNGQWDTSKVKTMSTVFRGFAKDARFFEMDDISGWDTSLVEDMKYMFHQTGEVSGWTADLSSWNVRKVTNHQGFCNDNGTRVVQPKWMY